MSPIKLITWILRIGVAGTFIGHGFFAFYVNRPWIRYLEAVEFNESGAIRVMPVIGVIDILVGLVVLIKPYKIVVLYAFIWAFMTALMRPLTGESIWMFIERAANFMAPLALYFMLSEMKDGY